MAKRACGHIYRTRALIIANAHAQGPGRGATTAGCLQLAGAAHDRGGEFAIEYTQFLDPSGRARGRLPEFAQDKAALIPLYRAMVLTRRFDAKAVALQRTGRLGTFASSLGQEAVVVGLASAMRPEDVLLPSYRETGAQLCRGVSLDELLLYWGGDERGSDFAGPRHDFPVSVPVASQCLHAVGVAYAMKLRSEARVAVCVFGDGRPRRAPSTKRSTWPACGARPPCSWSTTTVGDLGAAHGADRGRDAGAKGHRRGHSRLSGRRQRRDRGAPWRGRGAGARPRGDGPSVVEALTYRMSDHTTADDASRYRNPETVSERWAADPVPRLRTFLVEAGMWGKADEERLAEEINGEIDAAVERYLKTQPQPPEACSTHLLRRAAAGAGRTARGRRERPVETTMPEVTLVERGDHAALARAMADERVVVLGEDVGLNGGVFPRHAGAARALRAGARDRHAARRGLPSAASRWAWRRPD